MATREQVIQELNRRGVNIDQEIQKRRSILPDIGQLIGGLAGGIVGPPAQAASIPLPVTMGGLEAAGRGAGALAGQIIQRPETALRPPITQSLGGLSPAIPLTEQIGRAIATRTPVEREELKRQTIAGGISGAGGQVGISALVKVGRAIPQMVARFGQGIPFETTQLLQRFPREIFNLKSIRQAQPLFEEAVENTKNALVQGRHFLSKRIAKVEDAYMQRFSRGHTVKLVDITGARELLSKSLIKEGVGIKGAISSLPPSDQTELLGFLSKVSQEDVLPFEDSIRLRRLLDETIDYSPQIVKKVGSRAQGILKSFRNELGDKIKETAPGLRKVYEDFGEFARRYDLLKNKLSETNAERNLVRFVTKDTTENKILQELNRLTPKRLQFYDTLSNRIVSQTFAKPLRAGAAGSLALGGTALGAGAGLLSPKILLGLPVLSPLATGAAVRLGSEAARIARRTQLPAISRTLLGRGLTEQ